MIRAFTLIELLIVLALIGILSAIAYPLYDEHLVRARRAYAKIFLMDVAGKMEQYYAEGNTYDNASLENLHVNNDENKILYRLVITAKEDSFILQAVPLGKQLQHDRLCGVLAIDQSGAKTIGGSGSIDECW